MSPDDKPNTKPLIVLDVDETLISSQEQPLPHPPSIKVEQFHVYFRPQLFTFLKELAKHFEVAYWSAGSPDYVTAIIDHITTETKVEPLFVWNRSKCIRKFDFGSKEEYFLKDLRKLKRFERKLAKTLIIEDEPRKVWRNYGNAIYIRPFTGSQDDDELKLLLTYLISIRDEPDFRVIEKRFWRQ